MAKDDLDWDSLCRILSWRGTAAETDKSWNSRIPKSQIPLNRKLPTPILTDTSQTVVTPILDVVLNVEVTRTHI